MSYPSLLSALAALTLALFALSLLIGPAAISFGAGARALLTGEGAEAVVLVMQEIRLPRALLGLMIGVSLGLAGAVLQGLLRNPLAEPGLIGVTASASLGAVLAIYTGLSAAYAVALPIAGMAGALISVLIVVALAGARGGTLTLILSGVAVTSFAGAMTSLALNLAPNPFASLEIVFWMLGSLADRSMTHVWLAAPFMGLGWLMLAGLGRALDALTLGEEAAATLGFSVPRVRLFAVVGSAAAVGAATAVAGAIGFVGLVAPHLMRPLVGARPSRLLPTAALAGGAMVLAADIVVRLISVGTEVKLGVLTALVGAPFFLWLVLTTRRAGA